MNAHARVPPTSFDMRSHVQASMDHSVIWNVARTTHARRWGIALAMARAIVMLELSLDTMSLFLSRHMTYQPSATW